MIKELSKSIREYKKESLLTPLFVSIEVVLEVLITYNMALLIDNGVKVGNIEVLERIGIILFVMAIFSLIAGTLSATYCAKASAGFAKNLRHDIFEKIQKFSFLNIDKFKSSGLITRLTTDVGFLGRAYEMLIRIAIRSPLIIIFSIIMILKISKKMALIFLVVSPLLFLALIFIVMKVHPIFRKVFDEYDKLNNVVSENLNGIRVVKSFVSEDREIRKFKWVSNNIYTSFKKAENILALNGPIMQFFIYATMLLVAWIGAKLIVTNKLTTGELMSLFTYIMQVLNSLMMLSMVFVQIIISRESATRVCEVLNEKIDITNKDKTVDTVKDGSIIFENVNFSYVKKNDKLCLENINLTINSGEVIGIIGGIGTGKSTLVQLIPRLYDVTSGRILVGNVDVRDYDIYTLRENVAMVLQKNILFSGTILDNLSWGDSDINLEKAISACTLAGCNEFISNMDKKYDTHIEQGGTNVSGGQRQRLCIARAILKKPKIIIFDDSTSAVDTKTDSFIQENMKKLIPETTKIIIAQRISSVINCDRIIVMDNGMINGIGTHDELLKNNKIYKEVYESQQGGVINE